MNGIAAPTPAVQATAAVATTQSAAQIADLLTTLVKSFVRASAAPVHRDHDIAEGLHIPLEIASGVTQHLLKVGWLEPVGR